MRVFISALVLAPLGLGLGTAFPLGMRAAQRSVPQLTPWLWGVNGAASVSGSVLAVVVALGAGITAGYWLGAAFYVVALAAYGYLARVIRISDATAVSFSRPMPVAATWMSDQKPLCSRTIRSDAPPFGKLLADSRGKVPRRPFESRPLWFWRN